MIVFGAPVILVAGHWWWRWRGVLLAGVAFVLVTWLLGIVMIETHFAELEHRAATEVNPPREVEEWYLGDGSKRLGAYYLGWIEGAAYYTLWLIPYALFRIGQATYRHMTSDSTADEEEPMTVEPSDSPYRSPTASG